MATTYTPRLRLPKQGIGENNNTWGEILNDGLIELIEESNSGITELDLSTGFDYTLTTGNAVTDESRRAVLRLTGTPTANIQLIIPTVEKVYIVDNQLLGTNTVTITTESGDTFVVSGEEQRRSLIYTDGVDIILVAETFLKAIDAETLGDVTMDSLTVSGDVEISGDLKTNASGFLVQPRSDSVQTISSGVITPTGTTFIVDTEASAAVDDLVTINYTVEGALVNFRIADNNRAVTIKHGTGNIQTPSGQDIVLDNITQEVTLRYDYRDNKYHVVSQPQILATTADAVAGTNSSKLMTPSTTQDQILENLPVRVVAAGIFNSAGVAISSYNLSLVKNSVGDFTAVFDTPEPDANYIPYVGNGGSGSFELESYLNRAGLSTDVAPTDTEFRFTIINNGGNSLGDFQNQMYVLVYRIFV